MKRRYEENAEDGTLLLNLNLNKTITYKLGHLSCVKKQLLLSPHVLEQAGSLVHPY